MWLEERRQQSRGSELPQSLPIAKTTINPLLFGCSLAVPVYHGPSRSSAVWCSSAFATSLSFLTSFDTAVDNLCISFRKHCYCHGCFKYFMTGNRLHLKQLCYVVLSSTGPHTLLFFWVCFSTMQLRISSPLALWCICFVAGGRPEDHFSKERGEISWYGTLLDSAERSPALRHLSRPPRFLVPVSYSSSAMWHVLNENPYDVISKEVSCAKCKCLTGNPVHELWSQVLVENLFQFLNAADSHGRAHCPSPLSLGKWRAVGQGWCGWVSIYPCFSSCLGAPHVVLNSWTFRKEVEKNDWWKRCAGLCRFWDETSGWVDPALLVPVLTVSSPEVPSSLSSSLVLSVQLLPHCC